MQKISNIGKIEKNKDIFMEFVDMEKAFDSVNWNKIF